MDLVDSTRVEEDALGQRRLAGVDVGGDADVADAVEGDASFQGVLSSRAGGLALWVRNAARAVSTSGAS